MMRVARRAAQAGKLLRGDNSRCASSSAGPVQPELTAVRYKVERGPYAILGDAHVAFFESLLGPDRCITDPDECDGYNVDWFRTVKGT